jgi:hypothetical protein
MIQRTSDPNIFYVAADDVDPHARLGDYGVAEFRINTRDRKFIMTSIMYDGSDGPVADVTEMWERFLQEREHGRQA